MEWITRYQRDKIKKLYFEWVNTDNIAKELKMDFHHITKILNSSYIFRNHIKEDWSRIRRCTTCNSWKPFEEYHKRWKNHNWTQIRYKVCSYCWNLELRNKTITKWFTEHEIEVAKKRNRRSRLKNKDKYNENRRRENMTEEEIKHIRKRDRAYYPIRKVKWLKEIYNEKKSEI